MKRIMSKNKRCRVDFSIIIIWYNVAKLLSFTPISIPLHGGITKKFKLIPYLYPSILLIVYITMTIHSFHTRFTTIYISFNISQKILDILQAITESCFITHVVLSSILKKSLWLKLRDNLTRTERKFSDIMTLSPEQQMPDASLALIRVRIIIFHMGYVFAHLYDSITYWTWASYTLTFIIFRITTYYIMFSTLFIIFLCQWLEHRYIYLNDLLKNSIKDHAWPAGFLLLPSEIGRQQNLQEFSRHYRNLYLIVDNVNGVFNTCFFFITICTALEILNAVNYGIPTSTKLDYIEILDHVIYLVLYMSCYIHLVTACERVRKSAATIGHTSLFLLTKIDMPHIKQELLTLNGYIQGLEPQFSACDFWYIQQSNLSTLFASVINFLIIIIQFHITLKQK
ncbi:hypothetical protein ABEB36_006178 [Hypothenemus hampei]|uniref:Gustatory receptor n=1 Tax=Hypothenemus hampei TaxID=57062 RepID=A0ABD1EPN3_HYPHA